MAVALSSSKPYLRIKSSLESPPKIRSITLANFHLPMPPLLLHKIILTIRLTLPSSIAQQFLTSLFSGTATPTIY